MRLFPQPWQSRELQTAPQTQLLLSKRPALSPSTTQARKDKGTQGQSLCPHLGRAFQRRFRGGLSLHACGTGPTVLASHGCELPESSGFVSMARPSAHSHTVSWGLGSASGRDRPTFGRRSHWSGKCRFLHLHHYNYKYGSRLASMLDTCRAVSPNLPSHV